MKLLFLDLTNIGTHLSSVSTIGSGRIGQFYPEREAILLFQTIFGSAKYKMFGAS